MVEIGRRLRQARERAGLSQAEVAQEIGVTRPTLANWEAGRHQPSILQFRALITRYAASPYGVLFGSQKIRLSDDERDELMHLASRASTALRLKIGMALTLLAVDD